MAKSLLDEYFPRGEAEDGDWVPIPSDCIDPAAELASWQEEQLEFGKNWCKKHKVCVVVTADDVILTGLDTEGQEVGFPAGTRLVARILGIDAFIRKMRGVKTNGDAKGVGIIHR